MLAGGRQGGVGVNGLGCGVKEDGEKGEPVFTVSVTHFENGQSEG